MHTESPTLLKAEVSRRKSEGEASVDELHDAERAGQLAIVQALGEVLMERRKEATAYRTETGIESDWEEDEEFYQAIDKANPEGETHVGKPVSANGGAIGITQKPGPARSTVFIPITRSYVDAASARVSDMLLPTDDSPWSIKPTPVQTKLAGTQPSAITQAARATIGAGPMPEGAIYQPGKQVPAMDPVAAQAMGMSPEAAAAPAPYSLPLPVQPAGVNSTDKSAEELAAEQATKVITDWHIECQWHAEVRKVIEDAALLGTGILKGPFPVQTVVQKYEVDALGVGRMTRVTETRPISVRIHPRNLWCDPAAGEDIQKGSYVWERDNIGTRALRALKDDPSYIPELIDQVLREGPNKVNADRDTSAHSVEVGQTYPVWYFYGDLDRETLLAAGIPEEDFPDDGDMALPAMVTMVNDTVVRAAFNPMENGGFPYDVMPWQRRSGIIWGKGVARQVRTPQRMLNGAVRSMMDNGGLTSGPIWAIRQKWIRPIDNQNTLSPRKGFYMTEDAPPQAKISDAISFINVQSNTAEMKLTIDLALKFAEDATGLPMLMQGQQGNATDTAAGMTILNNNGSTVLRRIARTFDDQITERHIRRYYYWLLENPGNEDAKGDFQIDARGSTALVERDLQNQALNQLAPLLMQHPDIHPGRLAEELMKANRLDPKRVMLTAAEKAERDQQPPPPPIQAQVAEIREKGALQRQQNDLAFKAQRSEIEDKQFEAQLKTAYEQALGKIALDMNLTEQELRTRLAINTQTLTTQVAMGNADRQVATPRAEPPGRAEPGRAFSQ